jgi:hypothetical protein
VPRCERTARTGQSIMLLYAKDKQETAMLSTEFHDRKYQKLTKAKVFRKRKCESNKVTKWAFLHQHILSCEL